MVIYCEQAFRVAQNAAREAVQGGSKEGYDFDWNCAMLALKIAYGYAPLAIAEDYYSNEG